MWPRDWPIYSHRTMGTDWAVVFSLLLDQQILRPQIQWKVATHPWNPQVLDRSWYERNVWKLSFHHSWKQQFFINVITIDSLQNLNLVLHIPQAWCNCMPILEEGPKSGEDEGSAAKQNIVNRLLQKALVGELSTFRCPVTGSHMQSKTIMKPSSYDPRSFAKHWCETKL